MKYWSAKNWRLYRGFNPKDLNNWFHSFLVATGTAFGYPIEIYSLSLAWEVWNGGNPSYTEAPLHSSYFERNFLYSDGFSREDVLFWNGFVGLGVGFLIKGILFEFGVVL